MSYKRNATDATDTATVRNDVRLNGACSIGSYLGSAEFMDGDLFELVIMDGPFVATERADMDTYGTALYGY